MDEKKLKQLVDFSKRYKKQNSEYTLKGICRTRGPYHKTTDYIILNIIVSRVNNPDVSYAIPWDEFVQEYVQV